MKKAISAILLTLTTLLFISCGGKEMDSPPDYSASGPHYFNPDYHPHADTNTVRARKSFLETKDLSEPSMDSGSAGKEKSIVREPEKEK